MLSVLVRFRYKGHDNDGRDEAGVDDDPSCNAYGNSDLDRMTNTVGHGKDDSPQTVDSNQQVGEDDSVQDSPV